MMIAPFDLIAGEAWVNNVKILGWSQVKNGIIISIEDFLFTEHIDPDLISFPRELENEVDGNEPRPKIINKMYKNGEGILIIWL